MLNDQNRSQPAKHWLSDTRDLCCHRDEEDVSC